MPEVGFQSRKWEKDARIGFPIQKWKLSWKSISLVIVVLGDVLANRNPVVFDFSQNRSR